ncbi:MAG: ABC transporter substrate-binding protein [Thermomicrobiales bacterium]
MDQHQQAQRKLGRRTLLKATASAAAGAALINIGAPSRSAAQEEITIRWWDQFLPLEPLHTAIWEQYQTDHPGVTIEYTVYNPNEQGQALQLAFESDQMPDVHSLAGVGVPPSRLAAEGWFTPMARGEELRGILPEGSLLAGFTVFDGQIYSFPLFSFRQYTSLNWFNTELMEGAGIDPATGPTTWDEFRQAANAITESGGGGVFGWIQGLGFAERLGVHLNDLAQAAGAHIVGMPGANAVDPTTGEYPYASDPYVQALEFLVSLQQDGALFPASSSLDARTGRARWVTGAAGMFLDGPWNIGVIQTEFQDFLDKVGVAPLPTPTTETPTFVHAGPGGGVFWISSQSENPEVAEDILRQFTSPEYYVGLAERMDQPPLDLTAVERANVHPTYKRAIELFQSGVRLGPNAIVRNPAVAQVVGEMAEIHPNLGEIAQGAFSGDVTDYKATLQEYADKLTAERERALQSVQDQGVEVTLDDWVFSNWDPTQDFTAEMYGQPR